ncbi:MET27 protein, partial [Polypterus senegalus]
MPQQSSHNQPNLRVTARDFCPPDIQERKVDAEEPENGLELVEEEPDSVEEMDGENEGELIEDVETLEYRAPYLAAETLSSAFQGNRDLAVVLDVACGTGLVVSWLNKMGFRNFHGIDGSEGMLEMAKTKGLYQNLKYCMLGTETLSSPISFYDAVLIVGALSVGQVPVKVIWELWQVTKPGPTQSKHKNPNTMQTFLLHHSSQATSSSSSRFWLTEWWWLGPFIAHPEAFQVINHLVLIALPGGAESSSSRAVGSRQLPSATPGPNQAVEDSISHGALRAVGESPSAREAATKRPGGGIGLPMVAPLEHK